VTQQFRDYCGLWVQLHNACSGLSNHNMVRTYYVRMHATVMYGTAQHVACHALLPLFFKTLHQSRLAIHLLRWTIIHIINVQNRSL